MRPTTLWWTSSPLLKARTEQFQRSNASREYPSARPWQRRLINFNVSRNHQIETLCEEVVICLPVLSTGQLKQPTLNQRLSSWAQTRCAGNRSPALVEHWEYVAPVVGKFESAWLDRLLHIEVFATAWRSICCRVLSVSQWSQCSPSRRVEQLICPLARARLIVGGTLADRDAAWAEPFSQAKAQQPKG